jgi:hypothetical protein
MAGQREALHASWQAARSGEEVEDRLTDALRNVTAQSLERLYPGRVPAPLLAR